MTELLSKVHEILRDGRFLTATDHALVDSLLPRLQSGELPLDFEIRAVRELWEEKVGF